MQGKQTYKYLDIITAAFAVVLLVSNIASTKFVVLGPLQFDGGTVLFPLSYIFGDVLTEVYGYRRSRKVIWTGFVLMALAAATFALVDALPAAPEYTLGPSFHAILGQTPRIVVASLIAYFSGEFTNSFVMAKLKIATQGRFLWVRTIGSTLFGEGVDTCLFLSIAFIGVQPFDLLWITFLSNYVFKVTFETVVTPLTYVVVNFLKRAENEDYYDRRTNFNPFLMQDTQG